MFAIAVCKYESILMVTAIVVPVRHVIVIGSVVVVIITVAIEGHELPGVTLQPAEI